MKKQRRRRRERRLPSMIRSSLKDTVKNIQRNNLMSFASVVSIVATLIILGFFIIITINVDNVALVMRQSLELKVFLTQNATQNDIMDLEDYFNDNSDVTDFVYESKDEALERYMDRLENYSGLLEGFTADNNPISNSYTVAVESPEVLEDVKKDIEESGLKAVDYVKYGEQYVDAIMIFSQFSDYACLAVFAILSVISIIIIYNTIKLTCYSNRKEIEIMKMLGADSWYIKMPFFLEGLLLGILGAISAVLIIAVLYTYMIGLTDNLAYLPLDAKLVSPMNVLIPIAIFSLIYGIFMGAFGSLFSIRRYFYYA